MPDELPKPKPTKLKEPGTKFKMPGEDRPAQPLTRSNQSFGVDPNMPKPGQVASKAKTQASIKPMGQNAPQAASHLANLANSGLQDLVPDPDTPADDGFEDAYPPDMLPAKINRELSRQGDINFQPEWHQVRNLPGYIESAIRALGRQVFDAYTSTSIEDIQVLSTLSNDQNEVNMMAALLKKKGTRIHDAEMDFQNIMPGYRAQVGVYEFGAGQFLVVKDFAGHYIYSWPKEDGKYKATDLHGNGEAPQLQQGQKQLKAADIIRNQVESRSKQA